MRAPIAGYRQPRRLNAADEFAALAFAAIRALQVQVREANDRIAALEAELNQVVVDRFTGEEWTA